QTVLSFDHEVTQWMSRVILVRGSALNSDQLHALTGRGPTFSVKVQSAGSIRGVGPAVSTGKLSTRCCPGGILSDRSDTDWRPVKPRVTMADFLRRRLKGASSRTTRQAVVRRMSPYRAKHGNPCGEWEMTSRHEVDSRALWRPPPAGAVLSGTELPVKE